MQGYDLRRSVNPQAGFLGDVLPGAEAGDVRKRIL